MSTSAPGVDFTLPPPVGRPAATADNGRLKASLKVAEGGLCSASRWSAVSSCGQRNAKGFLEGRQGTACSASRWSAVSSCGQRNANGFLEGRQGTACSASHWSAASSCGQRNAKGFLDGRQGRFAAPPVGRPPATADNGTLKASLKAAKEGLERLPLVGVNSIRHTTLRKEHHPSKASSTLGAQAHLALETGSPFRLIPHWNQTSSPGSFLDWKMLGTSRAELQSCCEAAKVSTGTFAFR